MEEQVEDDITYRVCHQLGVERDVAGVHAPRDRYTSPVLRLNDDIAALMWLTTFELPPLQVVRPVRWCRYSMVLGTCLGNISGQPCPRTSSMG